MTEVALSFRSVHQCYRASPVLTGVDLTVRAGEFFALVGINGAGKTTLFKGMLDLLPLDQGEIRIFGIPHEHVAARCDLVYLPERLTPPGFFLGRDYLGYLLALHGGSFQRHSAVSLCQALGLDPAVLDRSIRSCSKGMTQKLGLAGALLTGKSLLLLDEPMSALDPLARYLLKEYLLSLRQRGKTLFFSTHLLADVEELCDRMAILHQGRIHFVGTPQECRALYPGRTLEESFIRCIGTAR
ncbi:MAG: ABC transporter ATP-binding protein [Magnetococcales bacterium]|nr:ABC transporter ATP-binding protein [Magnetococcales bacterium]